MPEDLDELFVGSSEEMFIQEILKYPLLSPEEEKELFIKYKNGDESVVEELILRNLRLVVYVAYKTPKYGIDIADKIQEGTIGLKKAIEKFDVDLGHKFSTYATWWIYQEIYRAIKRNKYLFSLSINMEEKLVRYRIAINQLSKLYGREPSNQEIAHKLNVSLKEVDEYELLNQAELSLNTPIADSLAEYGEFIIDKSQDVENIALNNVSKQNMINVIESLKVSKFAKLALYLRYGFYNEKTYKMQEIADFLGISKQRVEQMLKSTQLILSKHPYFYQEQIVFELEEKKLTNKLNFLDFFSNLNIETIMNALPELSELELSIIHHYFGNDLRQEMPVNYYELNYDIGLVIKKIKKIIYNQRKTRVKTLVNNSNK